MKYSAISFILLLACTQFSEPAALTVNCEKRSTGEACRCGCLEPAECIQGICLMTKLADGEGCIDDKQCLSSECNGKCTRETTTFECEQECHRDSNVGCYTRCR